jgi:hypothetical protein
MASSYLNIITFLLVTLLYYLVLKPSLTLGQLVNENQLKEYKTNNNIYLAVYVLLIIIIQFIVNASIITSTCGGSISENMGAAGLLTFIPWTLIFGVVVAVIIVYPGFKSAFSDVIGYFYVAGSANNILTELLINPELEKTLNDKNANANANNNKNNVLPVTESSGPPEEQTGGANKKQRGGATKEQLQEAADAIVKICGNNSILINQIVPSNFMDYWTTLKPLRKEKYQNDNSPETIDIQNKLFELVVTRDNVGEAMWYIYTGILITMIVQLKIATRGCVMNPDTMKQNYDTYLANEQQNTAQQDLSTSTTYTIT